MIGLNHHKDAPEGEMEVALHVELIEIYSLMYFQSTLVQVMTWNNNRLIANRF